MNKLRKRFTAGVAAFVATTLSAWALAATSPTDGTVNVVEVGPGSVLVQVQSGSTGTNFYAQLTSPCSAVPSNTPDTLKMYVSLAQAAVLSGKTVRIYWTACSDGTPYIGGMDLNK